MIQFNLLPDVKLEYIKTQRTKHMVISIATIVGGVALGLLVLMFVLVNVIQRQHLNSLNKNIQTNIKKLQSTPDLDKILTIQNQLKSLPSLHNSKPVSSRYFDFLTQLTPDKASLSQAKIDFTANTISLTGTADALSTVDKYVDTLKFTNYLVGGDSATKKAAFSGVVLTNFGKNDKGVSYQIDLSFDPAIFDSKNDVKLDIPNIISTRSSTEKPGNVFNQQTNGGTQ